MLRYTMHFAQGYLLRQPVKYFNIR